jgi:indolepyruvate ferredoxin oxidoreductase beta subunit
MSKSIRQQILISGVGGQGVLFITRLLAEVAINKGLPVFTSETHGMAQRGGTVVSHLKIGDFSSPLIRPYQADGLLVLREENIAQHGSFLKSEGWVVVNSSDNSINKSKRAVNSIDADSLAQEIGNPKAVNLIVLGFAMAKAEQASGANINLFCSSKEINRILKKRFSSKKKLLDASIKALETGYKELKK